LILTLEKPEKYLYTELVMDNNQNNQTPQQNPQDKIVQIGKYKVQVIRHLCIGATSCTALSPVFVMDPENKAVIVDGVDDLPDNIVMAAQSCPTKAIVITDTETGQQVWPA